MAVTTLDPNTALIIVDLQRGIVGSSFIHPIDGIVSRARALLDAFPAAAEVYENLRYDRAGLCRTALDRSVASERLARDALRRAARSVGGRG